ncbi:hypothetical protein G6L28_16480 [Agrobacterium larrymoorei]|uniref:Uncharacterized protein n=1 Tax=Agrobacterium tumefaciens TaxID=358 RepID=A0AA44FB04_AGRTU|nr:MULTISPECIES: hypothetical protein [Agrobacterium]NTB87837.1 hypothetical protein [Agrobacterium tumefaciens]NTC32075.1 hypothetical protein [Agrobacterium tumefaciens]NTJ44197.1 hypothetical protein [Agrobacterium larrymoorei]
MTRSPLISAIAGRLALAGYSEVLTPLKVAAVSFDFTAAFRGRDGRSLDLVLLVDTTTGDFGDNSAGRVRNRLEALSRALDVTGSRFVVTVILAGAALVGDVEAIAETCRVLVVETLPQASSGALEPAAMRQLEDRIRVLLPLEIPPRADGDGSERGAIEVLMKSLPPTTDTNLIDRVVEASARGEETVIAALSEVIGQAMIIERNDK